MVFSSTQRVHSILALESHSGMKSLNQIRLLGEQQVNEREESNTPDNLPKPYCHPSGAPLSSLALTQRPIKLCYTSKSTLCPAVLTPHCNSTFAAGHRG